MTLQRLEFDWMASQDPKGGAKLLGLAFLFVPKLLNGLQIRALGRPVTFFRRSFLHIVMLERRPAPQTDASKLE